MGTIEVNAKVSTIEVNEGKIIINLEKEEFWESAKKLIKKLEDIYYKEEYKEPIIGELAICWNKNKQDAVIARFDGESEIGEEEYINVILFESIEQFKEFIK